MNPKLESLFGWLMFLGLPILAVILFLAIWLPGRFAGFKQVTFDRARASLSAALSDSSRVTMGQPRRYGYFEVSACTFNVTVRGTNYPLAFDTAEEFQFAGQGRLAITTNHQFLWLDDRRGPKLIRDDYRVSKWRVGYGCLSVTPNIFSNISAITRGGSAKSANQALERSTSALSSPAPVLTAVTSASTRVDMG